MPFALRRFIVQPTQCARQMRLREPGNWARIAHLLPKKKGKRLQNCMQGNAIMRTAPMDAIVPELLKVSSCIRAPTRLSRTINRQLDLNSRTKVLSEA